MCCLTGRFHVGGLRDGQEQELVLTPGMAAFWEPGCWVSAHGDSRNCIRLRLNIAADYRLLAMRHRCEGEVGPLLARLQPGPRNGLQEALLRQLAQANDNETLNLLRCLLVDASNECLQTLAGSERARATFQAICHHLQEQAAHAPDRRDVAQALGIHVGHVSRLVGRFADCSFSDLLHRYQLGLALRLLTQTDRPVVEIARAAGFSSSSYFIRIFKAAQGCTPAQWRERRQTATSPP